MPGHPPTDDCAVCLGGVNRICECELPEYRRVADKKSEETVLAELLVLQGQVLQPSALEPAVKNLTIRALQVPACF